MILHGDQPCRAAGQGSEAVLSPAPEAPDTKAERGRRDAERGLGAPSHGFQLGERPSGPAGLAARERQSRSSSCLETPPQPSSEWGEGAQNTALEGETGPRDPPRDLRYAVRGRGDGPSADRQKGEGGWEVMPPGDVGWTHGMALRRRHSNRRKGYRSPSWASMQGRRILRGTFKATIGHGSPISP